MSGTTESVKSVEKSEPGEESQSTTSLSTDKLSDQTASGTTTTTSKDNSITLEQIARVMFELRLKRIDEAVFSPFIPYAKQLAERQKQKLRAIRKYNKQIKEIPE